MPLVLQIGLQLLAQAANLPAAAPGATFHIPACPVDRDPEDITVCGRRNDSNGYQLPAPERFDPGGTVDSVSRERHRLLDVGAVGIGSCSTVGPGGWTGCMHNSWREADEQWAGRNHGHGPGVSVQVGSTGRPPPQ